MSEILNTTRFDENLDLSTAYLGKSHMTQEDQLMIEEKFTITEQGYTVGKLLDSTECQILLDTGANKSFMSKSHYCCIMPCWCKDKICQYHKRSQLIAIPMQSLS